MIVAALEKKKTLLDEEKGRANCLLLALHHCSSHHFQCQIVDVFPFKSQFTVLYLCYWCLMAWMIQSGNRHQVHSGLHWKYKCFSKSVITERTPESFSEDNHKG